MKTLYIFFALVISIVVYGDIKDSRFRYNAPAVVTCTDASYITVRKAISLVATNGIVNIPAGIFYITNTIPLDKPVSIIAAGTNSTFWFNAIPDTTNAPDYFPWGESYEGSGVQRAPFFLVRSSNVKICGFNFQCYTQSNNTVTNRRMGILVSNTKDLTNNVTKSKGIPLTGINICSNLFNGAYYHAVKSCGVVYWNTHNNTFVNCTVDWGNIQGDSAGWAAARSARYTNGSAIFAVETNNMLTLGTELSSYFENNFDYLTTWMTNYPATHVFSDCGNGGSQVIRFNTYSNNTANSYPYNIYKIEGWDAHGNTDYAATNGDWRGTVFSEIYGNTVYANHNDYPIVDCRGGVMLLYSNIAYCDDQFAIVKVREEEDNHINSYSSFSTNPNHFGPFQDPVMLYNWSNSWRWVGASTNQFQNYSITSWDTNAIQLGVNWFTNSPWVVTNSVHASYIPLGIHSLSVK